MNNKKENQFMDWVMGVKGVRFPFFKEEEMPQVEMPIRKETEAEKRREKKKKIDEEWGKFQREFESVPVGHFPHERDSSWYPY